MSATTALVRLRLREIVRTWRVWVMPAAVVLLAVTGPLTARFTQEILGMALGTEQVAALSLPDPTAFDSYAQWTKNLTQIVVLVVVVMAAGAINAEVRSGVAAMLLVKPAGHTAYVLTHAGTILAFVSTTVAAGALVSWALTGAVFGSAPLGPVLGATAVWLVLVAVLVGAALLASATIDAVAGAAGVGIGAYFVLMILGALPPLARYTPAGLIQVSNAVAAGTQPGDATLWWPVGSGTVLAVMLLTATVVVFRRREL